MLLIDLKITLGVFIEDDEALTKPGIIRTIYDPTLDHLVLQARGGPDDASNWITCSMTTNAAKSNWTLEELNWQLRPVIADDEWDGLSRWYLENYESKPEWAENQYLKSWYKPTTEILKAV